MKFIQLTHMKDGPLGPKYQMGVRVDLITAFGETPLGPTEVGLGSTSFIVKESVPQILKLITEAVEVN